MDKNQVYETAKEQRRAYYRKWRKKNSHKIREYNRRYWERKAEIALKKGEETEVTSRE